MTQDHHEIEKHRSTLGLGRRFGRAELKEARHQLAIQWHPDKFKSETAEWDEAHEKIKAINTAFEVLKDILDVRGGTYSSVTAESRHTENQQKRNKRQTSRGNGNYQGNKYAHGFPDPTVTEVFVQSSHIISAGYSRPTRTLYIKVTWGLYRYSNVPESVFEEFLKASSHGRFRHRWISPVFKEELLDRG